MRCLRSVFLGMSSPEARHGAQLSRQPTSNESGKKTASQIGYARGVVFRAPMAEVGGDVFYGAGVGVARGPYLDGGGTSEEELDGVFSADDAAEADDGDGRRPARSRRPCGGDGFDGRAREAAVKLAMRERRVSMSIESERKVLTREMASAPPSCCGAGHGGDAGHVG